MTYDKKPIVGGVKYKNVSCATSGDNTLIAAVTGKRIVVLAMTLLPAGTAVSCYLSSKDNTGAKLFADGTNKFALDMSGTAGARKVELQPNIFGWFATAAGEALNLNLSAAQAVVGTITYVED